MERKIYNIAKKNEAPKFCITVAAVIYNAPAGFTLAKGAPDRINFTKDEATGNYVDPDGGIWSNGGHNPGCGPRCPSELRAKKVEEVATTIAAVPSDEATAAVAEIGEPGDGAVMALIWPRLTLPTRKLILKVTKG